VLHEFLLVELGIVILLDKEHVGQCHVCHFEVVLALPQFFAEDVGSKVYVLVLHLYVFLNTLFQVFFFYYFVSHLDFFVHS